MLIDAKVLSPGVPRSIGLDLPLSSFRSDVDMACGELSSKKEKADSTGETRPWSRLATVKVWPTGVGKSLAVGVGTRAESGEIDLDLGEEGMLQVDGCGKDSGIIGGTNGVECKQ